MQKNNSHYAPQPQTNKRVFTSLLNCTIEMSLSRNVTGREFQRHVWHAYLHDTTVTCEEYTCITRDMCICITWRQHLYHM